MTMLCMYFNWLANRSVLLFVGILHGHVRLYAFSVGSYFNIVKLLSKKQTIHAPKNSKKEIARIFMK